MKFIPLALSGFALALCYFTAVWVLSLILRDASIVDSFWGPGFFLQAALYAVLGDGFPARNAVVVVLMAVYGARLGLHIFTRNRGRGEDYRYREMRAKAGSSFWWRSLPTVFWLQAVLQWIVAAPLLAAQRVGQPAHITGWDITGIVFWVVGLFWEAVGDWQLRRFKADPANKGRVLQTGLWRYSRHPNYFGETVIWWGMYLIALGTPLGFLSIAGPVLMTFLLLRVSGVALLEKGLARTKPEYEAYAARTSAFIPWFPKK